jgi:SAM-dependent methyltransferase
MWRAKPPEPEVVELVARIKAEGRGRAHDLGCGMGRHLLYLAAEGLDASGSDISEAAVSECRERLAQTDLTADVWMGGMADIGSDDGSLDAVIAWDVLYHGRLAAIRHALDAIGRKLAPGGYLLATFNSVESTSCRESRRAVTRGEAEELEPNTFVVPGDVIGDKAVPHHYATATELRQELLAGFEVLELERHRSARYEVGGKPHRRVSWHVLARTRDERR